MAFQTHNGVCTTKVKQIFTLRSVVCLGITQTTQLHGAPRNTISSDGMGIDLFLPEREIQSKNVYQEKNKIIIPPQDHLPRAPKH